MNITDTIKIQQNHNMPSRMMDLQCNNNTVSFAKTVSNQNPKKLEDKVRNAAEQLVSSSFVLPILQQLQNDPFRSDLFHGGQAENMFSQQLNTQIADDIVKRSNYPVAEHVYNQIMNRVNQTAHQNTTPQTGIDTHA